MSERYLIEPPGPGYRALIRSVDGKDEVLGTDNQWRPTTMVADWMIGERDLDVISKADFERVLARRQQEQSAAS